MGSETESKDLEVKKAHTRTRSKQKQEKNEELISDSSNLNNGIMDKSSNGTAITAKKGRGKRSQQIVSDLPTESTGSAESQDIEESRKTRRGKRMAKKKSAPSETVAKEFTPKRIKKDRTVVDDKEDRPNNDDDENDDTKKPKKPSKRQLKRERAEQRESLKKQAGRLEATDRALNYVSKWKHARSEWKFEKIRQIWLMDNLLDDDLIPDEIFPTVLEYFEGCKGMAREQLLKKGMDVIRKREENEETANEGAEESVEYRRARQLLQALPTET